MSMCKAATRSAPEHSSPQVALTQWNGQEQRFQGLRVSKVLPEKPTRCSQLSPVLNSSQTRIQVCSGIRVVLIPTLLTVFSAF